MSDLHFVLLQASEWVGKVKHYSEQYGIRILSALLILVIGRWVSKVITRLVSASMNKAKVDPTLITFIDKLIYIGLLAVVIISALTKLGVEEASLLGVIGAAGLAVGLALQGGLSNFAAGVLIIFFRPFRVGDLIDAAGSHGYVKSIELFTSTIITLDNKNVIIPNSQLTSDKIINYTVTDHVRMDLIFGVAYKSDIDKVKEICMDVISKDQRVMKDPKPFVGVHEHGASSVNFAVRPWVKVKDYWPIYFDIHEQMKKEFDKNGIEIPFPQRDVHLHTVEK